MGRIDCVPIVQEAISSGVFAMIAAGSTYSGRTSRDLKRYLSDFF